MIQKIKGTMDILPDKTPLFRYIEGIMREEAEKYGFGSPAHRVAAQKQHSVLFLGRGLNLCSLSITMRETTTQFPFVDDGYVTWIRKPGAKLYFTFSQLNYCNL